MKFLNDDELFKNSTPYQGDILDNRKQYGEALNKLISKIEDGCVISIDGRWGEGKTAFAQWWKNDLQAQGFPVVYFDAFKCDFNKEPFLDIASTLIGEFPDSKNLNNKSKSALDNFKDKIFPDMLNFILTASSIAASNCIDDETTKSTSAAILTGGIQAVTDFSKRMFEKKTITLGKTIDNFRNSLEDITTTIYSDKGKKLIFIIDEIDRCRPTYAVEIIEKIKHLFAVRGIIWVLVMNKEQLENSIKHIYGTIDTCLYLNKFINISTCLPKITKENKYYRSDDHYCKIVNHHIKECQFSNEQKETLKKLLSDMVKVFELSMRDIRKVIFNLELLFDIHSDYLQGYLILCSFLSILKESHYGLFIKVKNRNITLDQLQTELLILKKFDKLDSPLKWLLFYIQFALSKHIGEKAKSIITEEMSNSSDSILRKEYHQFCSQEVDYIADAYKLIDAITGKLDLFDIENKPT